MRSIRNPVVGSVEQLERRQIAEWPGRDVPVLITVELRIPNGFSIRTLMSPSEYGFACSYELDVQFFYSGI